GRHQGAYPSGVAPSRRAFTGSRDRRTPRGRRDPRDRRTHRSAAMIYPTRRAILLAFIGAPLSLVAALAAPGLWFVGVAWLLLVLASICADALLGGWGSEMQLQHKLPTALSIGGGGEAQFQAVFASRLP